MENNVTHILVHLYICIIKCFINVSHEGMSLASIEIPNAYLAEKKLVSNEIAGVKKPRYSEGKHKK